MVAPNFQVDDELVWNEQMPHEELIPKYGSGPFIVVSKLLPPVHDRQSPPRVIIKDKQTGEIVRNEQGVIQQFNSQWFRKSS